MFRLCRIIRLAERHLWKHVILLQLLEIWGIKKQIAQYKRIRRTVQFGAYYRLADPFSENQSAWNFVSEDGKQIVFSHVQILARSAYRIPTLRLRGLDPKAEYKNVETGEVFGGDELMYAGITIPRVRQDFSATMIIFEKM